MKNLVFIKVPLAFILVFSMSCQDLDEEPFDLLVEENVLTTVEDLALTNNGAYSLLSHKDFYGRGLSIALMLRSEMMTMGSSTTQRRVACDQMNMESDNGLVDAFWPIGYQIIAATNITIKNAVNISGSDEEINQQVAHARFLRAFVHFTYVRLFGEIVMMDEDRSSLTLEEVLELEQSSVAEIYDFIIADLEFAKEWLPNISESQYRPSSGSATGMLSKVYLTRATSEAAQSTDFQMAYNEAKEVIDNAGLFNYALETDFGDLFVPETFSQEILFELAFIGGDAANNPDELGASDASQDDLVPLTGPRSDERFAAGPGWASIVPAAGVYDTWDGRDYRKAVSLDTMMTFNGEDLFYTDWTFDVTGNTSAVNRAHVAKYFRAVGQAGGVTGSNQRDSNGKYIIMRYAEILLIAAEALNEINGGPNAEAERYINMVRARARNAAGIDDPNYPGDTGFPSDITSGLSQSQFLNEILEERRLEFAFEFVRWYDIQRRKIGEEVFSGTSVVDIERRDFNPAVDYLFPKFADDILRMDGLIQNFGY